MLQTTPITRRDIFVLLLICLLATLMRFYRGDVVEYFHDDAMLASMAQEMVTGGDIPLTGILSSTGIPNPPTSVYVMAVPFALSLDPLGAIAFVLCLNVLGVGLVWLMGHRYFGRMVGFWAGVFYALSPWAVFYSRKIWAQDFHTPFILLALLLALMGFCEVRPRRWAQILALPILLFGIQIHFAGWALLPLYVVVLWLGRKNMRWGAILMSIILTAIVLLPFVLGIMQTLQADPNRVGNAFDGDTRRQTDVQSSPLRVLVAYISDANLTEFILPCHLDSPILSACLAKNTINEQLQPFAFIMLRGLFFAVGVLTMVMTLLNRRVMNTENQAISVLGIWLLLWAFMPFAVLLPQWTTVYAHYFIATLPAFALISAIGVDFVLKWMRHRRFAIWLVPLCIAPILLGQFGYMARLWHFFDTTALLYPYFTTPLHYLKTIEKTLQEANTQDVVVVSDGMAWNLNHEVAVWETLLKGDVGCVRTIKDGYFVQPLQQFSVLVANQNLSSDLNALYSISNLQVFAFRQPFPSQYDNGLYHEGYTLYQHAIAPSWTQTPLVDIPTAVFDNGVQLTGYDIGHGMIVLRWSLTRSAPRGEDYQYSVQFFDGDNQRVGQDDRRFWQGMHWCMGDTLITYSPYDLTVNIREMRVGMYRLGEREGEFLNANLLDSAGNPIGQQVIIALP
jgi:hypothetical protein